MSFMNGKTKDIPEEHRAQLRMFPPDRIDRLRYPLHEPAAQLSLEDRERQEYAQRSGKPYQPVVETKPRPHNSDDGLNNVFLLILMIMLVPTVVLMLMWYVHLKPAQ